MNKVYHVEQKVGVGEFLEGGSESGHQNCRELLDEADGVGEEDGADGVDMPASGDGVQGGEKLVGGKHARACQGVQKGTLAGVCVADQGHDGQATPAPVLPVEAAVGPDVLDLLLEAVDFTADETTVGLQLGLTRAPRADSPAETFKVFPLAGKSREKVFVLSKLNLESAFPGAGAGGEDVEDEGGTVDDLDLEFVLEGSLL